MMFLIALLALSNAQLYGRIQCPMVSCNNFLGENVCYRVIGGNPFLHVGMASCGTNEYCDYEDVAWTDSNTHFYESGFEWNSTHYFQRKEARCHEARSIRQDLNPGRKCSMASQCHSGMCEDGVCVGWESGHSCSESR